MPSPLFTKTRQSAGPSPHILESDAEHHCENSLRKLKLLTCYPKSNEKKPKESHLFDPSTNFQTRAVSNHSSFRRLGQSRLLGLYCWPRRSSSSPGRGYPWKASGTTRDGRAGHSGYPASGIPSRTCPVNRESRSLLVNNIPSNCRFHS